MKRQETGPREKMLSSRGNSAQKSKDSILIDTMKFISCMHGFMPNVTQLQRREGAWKEMKLAALQVIRYFNMARANNDRDRRLEYIDQMIGEMGVVDAMFGEMLTEGVLTDKIKLQLAQHLDRMDRGIVLWRDSTRRATLRNQVVGEVGE